MKTERIKALLFNVPKAKMKYGSENAKEISERFFKKGISVRIIIRSIHFIRILQTWTKYELFFENVDFHVAAVTSQVLSLISGIR